MKKIKGWISWFLTLVIILQMLPIQAFAETGNNKLNRETKTEILGDKVSTEKESVNIISTQNSLGRIVLDIQGSDKKKLDNVSFKLTNESNENILFTGKSKNGKVVFDNLQEGDYRLEQLSLVDGYEKNSKSYIVNVKSNGQTIVKDGDSEVKTELTNTIFVSNNYIINSDIQKIENVKDNLFKVALLIKTRDLISEGKIKDSKKINEIKNKLLLENGEISLSIPSILEVENIKSDKLSVKEKQDSKNKEKKYLLEKINLRNNEEAKVEYILKFNPKEQYNNEQPYNVFDNLELNVDGSKQNIQSPIILNDDILENPELKILLDKKVADLKLSEKKSSIKNELKDTIKKEGKKSEISKLKKINDKILSTEKKEKEKKSVFSGLSFFRSAISPSGFTGFRSAQDGTSDTDYDVNTNSNATTVGDNNGFYKVDVTDFKFFSGIRRGYFGVTAKMILGIRLPQGAKAGDKFTLKLPEDFRLHTPLNSYKPMIRLVNSEDRTQVIATVKYKEGTPENPTNRTPNVRHLKHYLEGEITLDGEKILSKTGYKGEVTFGNTYRTLREEAVDGDTSGNKKFDFGLEMIASHWTSDRNPGNWNWRRRNIRKTFYFENSYNGDKDTLKDQSSFIYSNREWIKQHYGYQTNAYGEINGVEEGFERDNMNQTVDYYLPGDEIKGVVRTVQGNVINAVKNQALGTFILRNKDKINTNIDDFTLYKVTNSDKQINSYRGDSITQIARKKQNNSFNNQDADLTSDGKILHFKRGNTFYWEQNLSYKPTNIKPIESYQPGKNNVNTTMVGSKFMAYKIEQEFLNQTDQRFFHNVRADAFMEPSREIVIAKIAKEDRDKDGVPEDYLIKSSPAVFNLYRKNQNGYRVPVANRLRTKDGIIILSTSEPLIYNEVNPTQKNKLEKGVVYELDETTIPNGFEKPNQQYRVYFMINNDNTVRYGFSENQLTENPYGNKLIDGKEIYNGGYIPFEDVIHYKNEFKLKKIDSLNLELGLNGARFSVINLDTGAMFETYTKTINGEVGVIKFTKSELPDGKYKIVEIQAPSGYELPQKNREVIFWVKGGNYYNTNPNSTTRQQDRNKQESKYATNIENTIGIESISKIKKENTEKSSKNLFSYFSSLFKPSKVYADGPNQEQTYEVGLLRTSTPMSIKSGSKFKQVFYINPNQNTPNTDPSGMVFSIYGDSLRKTGPNSWQKTNTPSSAVIDGNTIVKVYKPATWWDGSTLLPENPNEFDPNNPNTTNATEVTNIQMGYDSATNSYEVNLGNRLDNQDTYVIVVEGNLNTSSGDPVVTSGALINKRGQTSFPLSILPNSGSVITQSKGRKKPHLILLKHDIVGIPIEGVEYTVRNNKTGQTYIPTSLDKLDPVLSRIRYGKEIKSLPPGVYTITETSVNSQNGVDYVLPNETWEVSIGADNVVKINTPSELIKESTNTLNSDYIILDIYNKPVKKPGKLILNLYKQDGTTPLEGGEFTLTDDETGLETEFSIKGNKFTIDLPVDFKSGAYTIKQKTIPTDPITGTSYVNNEPQWKIMINRDARNGRWITNLRTDYHYIDYDKSGVPNAFTIFNRLPKEEPKVLLPPDYGDVAEHYLQNLEFVIKNVKQDNGKFILKKTDGTNPLNGAIFNLTGITDTQYTKEINLLNKSEIQVNNLPKGEYTLTETKAPQGYIISNKTWKIKVLEKNNKIVTEIYENGQLLPPIGDGTLNELTVVNKKPGKGKFIVNKQGFDSEHDTTPESLSGVQFKLVKIDEQGLPISGNEAYSKILTTGNNGQAVFDELDKGKYKLTEIKTINGYIKKDDYWLIKVDNRGSVTYESIKAPLSNTGSSGFRSALYPEEDLKIFSNVIVLDSLNKSYQKAFGNIQGTSFRSVQNSNIITNENGIFNKQVEETAQKGVFNVTTTITGKTTTTQVEDTAKPNFIFLLENDNGNMGNGSNRAIGDIKNFLRSYNDIDGATFTIIYYSNGNTNYLRVNGENKNIPINSYNNIPNLSTNSNNQTGIWKAFEKARSAKNNQKNILIHVGYNMAYDFYDSQNRIRNELRRYDDSYGFVANGQQGYDQAFPNPNHVNRLQNNRSPYSPGFNRIKASVNSLLENSSGGTSTSTVAKTIRDATLDDRFDGSKFELASEVRAEGNTSGVTINTWDGQIIANHLNLGENESYTLKYQIRLKRHYWNNNNYIIGNASVSQNGRILGETQIPEVSVTPDNINIVARIMNPPADLQSVTFELVDGSQVVERQEVHGNGWTYTFRNKEAERYQVRVGAINPNNKYNSNQYYVSENEFLFTLDRVPKVNAQVILRGQNIGFTSADLVLKKNTVEKDRYTVHSNDLSKEFIINEGSVYDYKVDLENLQTTNSNYKLEKDDEENPRQYTLTFGEQTNLPVSINNPSENMNFVKFVLVKDGQDTNNTITLNSNNNWQDAFSNIPVYENGRKIEYSMKIAQIDPQSSSDEISIDTSTGTPIIIQHPTITVKNYKVTGHFEIVKTDRNQNLLSGAIFTLTRLGENGQELTGQENVFTQTSAENTGKLAFNSLVPGKYKLVETKAPTGYELSKDYWIIIVANDGQVTVTKNSKGQGQSQSQSQGPTLQENQPETMQINHPTGLYNNYFPTGNIMVEVNWIDDGSTARENVEAIITGTYIDYGVVMNLTNDFKNFLGMNRKLYFGKQDGAKYWNGLWKKNNYENPIDYKVSLNFINGNQGNWKVHYDYPTGEDKVKITIFKDSSSGSNTSTGNTTTTENITLTGDNNTFEIINEPKNEIEFTKIDGKDNRPLAGAEFILKKKSDTGEYKKVENSERISKDTPQGQPQTDKGKFVWKGLPTGEYQVWETKPPKGYVPRGHVVSFKVNSKGKIIEVKDKDGNALGSNRNIENFKAKYPDTGSMGIIPFIIVGSSLMAIAYINLRKRKYFTGGNL